MSNYVKTVDFAAKDALPTGNPNKIARGTQVDTELNNIATAIATKEDLTNKAQAGGYASLGFDGFLPEAQLSTNIPRLNANNTFTGATQTLSATAPKSVMTETGAGSDAKNWIIRSSSGIWALSTSTDAAPSVAINNAITVTRTGTTVGIINLLGTAVQVNGNAIWHTGNDGSGSGLDADTVDGSHASAFALASHVHSAADITTGTLAVARGGTGTTTSTGTGSVVLSASPTLSGTITGGTFSGTHSGDGSAVTNLNASNLSAGTVPSARITSASVAQWQADLTTRNISAKGGVAKTLSTSAPSGGSDGDIWYQY
jgi:hypothetical protein